jgi:trehalose/maltose hydrolase-like predicted phosphorylase
VPVATGALAEHINSDVAWAVLHHATWTGDRAVLNGRGRELVTETAAYWAARIRLDDRGRGHIDDVIGPDEYHVRVDDNAYTNGMVAWHLHRAADLVAVDGRPGTARRWRSLAEALVDGYDPRTGRHEQFAGYSELEPVLVRDVAPPPVAADLLLGHDRVQRTQLVKQPDVLMLHHLLPDHVPAGSLAADLDHYLPRTAHGSSLSPAICASLLARAGRPEEAVELFQLAARLDLDDLTGTTAGGLHLATMGGLWQAVVTGFAGLRVVDGRLRADPHLPRRWRRLRIRLFHRGEPLVITVGRAGARITSARRRRRRPHRPGSGNGASGGGR